jgi:hypothetical protein
MEAKKQKPEDTTDILHHVGLINHSLERSASQYEKLGFTLTPLSLPKVPLTPGGIPEILGAGNRHAIFQHNYLELLGIVDPERWAAVTVEQRGPYDLDVPLSRYEGLHVMHFGTDHIEKVKERLDKQAIPSSPIKAFQRNVQTENGERTMKARTIHFPPASNPEGLLQVAQHDTPELIFQDRYMHHRNGAIALTEIIVVTEDPAGHMGKYEQYSGHKGRNIAEGYFQVNLGHAKITIVDPPNLDYILPGYKVPHLPFLAAFTIRTASLQLVRNVLSEANISFAERNGSILVYPENACGSAILFS